jgi:hypothetical protein
MVQVSRDRNYLCQLGYVPSEDGDNPLSKTLCVLNKNSIMDKVHKDNNCINMPSSQTSRPYKHFLH